MKIFKQIDYVNKKMKRKKQIKLFFLLIPFRINNFNLIIINEINQN